MKLKLGEKAMIKAIPDDLVKILEAQNIRECILEDLIEEIREPKEHLNDTDVFSVIMDSVYYPNAYAEGKQDHYNLHLFTMKSVDKCRHRKE